MLKARGFQKADDALNFLTNIIEGPLDQTGASGVDGSFADLICGQESDYSFIDTLNADNSEPEPKMPRLKVRDSEDKTEEKKLKLVIVDLF